MDEPVYIGQSQLLHYWPSMMVTGAAIGFLFGGPVTSVILLVPGVVVALLLPWRFAVLDRGIALWFPFGKYRYLAKEQVTVRVGHGSTVLLPRRADRFGYPLTDGLVERRRSDLRAVLTEHGFDVASLTARRGDVVACRPASNGTAPSPGRSSKKCRLPNRPELTSDIATSPRGTRRGAGGGCGVRPVSKTRSR